MCQINLL